MPIEIRELIIKATLSDPPPFSGEAPRLAEGEKTGELSLTEWHEHDPRWRQLIAAQLERLLPAQIEKLLRDRLSEQALSDQMMQILARMKER